MRLLPLLLLSGCVGTLCRGPGCEDVWPGGRVLVLEPFSAGEATTGAASFDLSGSTDEGAGWAPAALGADLYVGMPEVGRVVRWSPADDSAALQDLPTWRGPQRELGAVVAVVDPRNNGLPTLAASAPGADLDSGAVVVWESARVGARAFEATRVLQGASPADRLGEAMVYCPDLTGDELPDLLVSAPAFSGGPVPDRGGRVFLVPSQLGELGPLPFGAWSAQARSWHGEAGGVAAGSSLACGVDLTGDGVGDVVIGAPGHGSDRQGAFWILDGAALPADGGLGEPTRVGASASSWLGTALAVGDLDGDGLGDLAVGAAGASSGQGEIEVHYGPVYTLPRSVIEAPVSEEFSHLGRELLLADLDGDGLDELVVGAEDRVDGEDFDAGWVGVWRGSATRMDPNLVLTEDEDWSVRPNHAFQRLGAEVVAHEQGLIVAVRSRGF